VQDLVTPAVAILADGCHPNRDTLAALEASRWKSRRSSTGGFRRSPASSQPLLIARARRS
jgi:hypothetical protein